MTEKDENQELRAAIAKQGNVSAPIAFEQSLKTWFAQNAKRMTTLAGSKEEAQKMVVTLLHIAQRNPKIMRCTQRSIGECLMQSAALGLYPGPMQQCAYVPYGDVLTFIPQYQGIATLAYQSGFVRSVNSGVVKTGDFFEYMKGSDPFLHHREGADRGENTHAWAVIKMEHGDPIIEVMAWRGKDSIESIMARSPAAKRGGSPWQTDPEEMARKTVLKRALKAVPKTQKLAEAIAHDNEQERPDLAQQKIVALKVENVISPD